MDDNNRRENNFTYRKTCMQYFDIAEYTSINDLLVHSMTDLSQICLDKLCNDVAASSF